MHTATTPGRSAAPRLAAGIGAMTLVGSSVGISHTLIHAPLFAAQALRYAAAVLILLAMARSAPSPAVRPRGREWLWLAGIAATGLVLFNVAIVRGVAHAEPAVIAVAVACVPVLLGIIGPLLEHQAPRRTIVLAALVVTIGGVLVEGTGRTDAAGIAWAAVVLGCEAAFTLLAVPVLSRHGGWGVSLHSAWMGAVMLIVLSLVTEGPAAVARLTAPDWAAMGYLAVMTAVAFVLWYSTVAAFGAGPTGLLTGIAPVAAAVTGIAAGSQAPRPLVWLGILVVICGLVAGLWTRPPRSARAGGPGQAGGPARSARAGGRVRQAGGPARSARAAGPGQAGSPAGPAQLPVADQSRPQASLASAAGPEEACPAAAGSARALRSVQAGEAS